MTLLERDDWVVWAIVVLVGALLGVFILLSGYEFYEQEFAHPCDPRDICDHYESVTGTGVSTNGGVVVTSSSVCTRTHVGVGTRCKEAP